jgi:predicted phage terminase large subunit-like protein
MSNDQRAAAQYLLQLKKAGNSFPGFMDYMYPEFSFPGFMREFQEVLDLLEKDKLLSPGGNPVRSLLVSMPPRHAKSFNGTVNFPAYCLMRKPYRELMVSAYNNDLATTFGRGTRDIAVDKRARKAFSGFDLSRETRAVDFWKTTEGGAYYAVGLDGTTTGRGANGLFVDDPYKSREEADSITRRRRIWNFYVSGLLSRLQPDRDGQPPFKIVTHTRWHPDDMAGRIMESEEFKRGEWIHLNFEALRMKDRGVYIRRSHLPKTDPAYMPEEVLRSDGRLVEAVHEHMSQPNKYVKDEGREALWPERFGVEWLLKQREILGDREFSALYQQQPYVLGGNIVKEHWFQRYSEEHRPAEFHALVMTADTAFKTKSVNDYSVISLFGVTEIGDIYLLRVWRFKLEYPDLKRKIIEFNATYRGKGLRGVWIEDAGSGQSLIQEMRSGSGVAVIGWKPGAHDKTSRLNMVTPLIEGGRVFIPQEADWLEDWLNEIVSFPSSKNDDQVDGFVMGLDVCAKMVVTGVREFSTPIGDFLQSKDFSGSLAFTGKELAADPNGWGSQFGKIAKQVGGFAWGE